MTSEAIKNAAIVVFGIITCWYINRNRDVLKQMLLCESMNKAKIQDWHTVADTVFRYPGSLETPNTKLDDLLNRQWPIIKAFLEKISSSVIVDKIKRLAELQQPQPIDQVFKSLS